MQNYTPLKMPDLSANNTPKIPKKGFSKGLLGTLVAFVLMVGVVTGYVAMKQGFVFKQRAQETCFDPKTQYGSEAAWNPHFLEFFDWSKDGFENKSSNVSVNFTYKGSQPLCNPLKFVLLTYKGTGDTLATSQPQTLNSYAEATITNDNKSASLSVPKPTCGNMQLDFSYAVNPSSCTNGNCPFDIHGKNEGVWGVYGVYQSTKDGGTIEYPGGNTVKVADVAVACQVTPTPIESITPPQACVLPSAVKNVQVTCPLCTAQ